MRALLVDDSKPNLLVYEKILARIPDLSARAFTSSAEALVWCAKDEPDLIVLDYRMPAPDGLEFIQYFRGLWPNGDTPIVMITGEKDKHIRHRALELGASDFINKPADPVEFLARVRNLLALRESRIALRNRADSLARDVERATRDIAEREEETIHRLMRAAEFRDNETGNHIVRMGEYAGTLGAALGFSVEDCRLLRLATPMHDIGKVSTPDAILLKPGPLTPEEWTVMRNHTTAGYEILKGSSSRLIQLAAEIALSHHERFDGTGYPAGTKGAAIPASARICAIVDVFDALTSERPYKESWDIERAFSEIERLSGSHFDPKIVQAFDSIKPGIRKIKRQLPDDAVAMVR